MKRKTSLLVFLTLCSQTFFPAESTDPSRSACLHLGQLSFTTHTVAVKLSKLPDISPKLTLSFFKHDDDDDGYRQWRQS